MDIPQESDAVECIIIEQIITLLYRHVIVFAQFSSFTNLSNSSGIYILCVICSRSLMRSQVREIYRTILIQFIYDQDLRCMVKSHKQKF